MTTITKHRQRVGLGAALAHTAVITRRNTLRVVRLPQLLLFSTIQPVMFLLLFNYVFGGAISIGGPEGAVSGSADYINWLIPGILVQTAVFGATATALGLTEDLGAGVIDRFRSLPMARSAVLAGRTIADLVRNTFVNTLMLVVGFLMGWRFEQGVPKMLLGVVLALLFGYAFSWVMATIGLVAKTPEAAQSAGFLPIFPLVFASSVFVPTASMPQWLQVFAENQPVSVMRCGH
ncbi:MAG TPA: ABC transporter permease [Acidimicrobiia bacterium]|nr:ABC transporter permease [Acidimicrobiia bacterium]